MLCGISDNTEEYPIALDRGLVLSVKDGICAVDGLLTAMAGELVYVFNRRNRLVAGMVLQLLFTTIVVILFGADSDVDQGCPVLKTDGLVTVNLDYRVFGKVIDALGETELTLTDSFSSEDVTKTCDLESAEFVTRRVDSKAAGIIARAPVRRPMQTGILSVDSLTPIGCGQRELIIGDRQTGKTTIAIDTIVNQGLNGTLHCIYVAVGQKRSTIAKLSHYLNSIHVMGITVIVATSAADTAALQYLSPFTGCTLGEWLGECGGDALVVYDDLSKQAVAYRQISLLLRRAPTREAYPGDVFFLHARLLERSAHWSVNCGGGSLTALPIVETQAGDVTAFVPTNVISITDGQIYLESLYFSKGIRPAINAGISVSRVGAAAQVGSIRALASNLKLALAQYREVEAYSVFAGDLDPTTRKVLFRGIRLIEVLNQNKLAPYLMETQVILLYAGVTGHFDDYTFDELVTQKGYLLNQIETTNICFPVGFDLSRGLHKETISTWLNWVKRKH